MFDIMKTLFSLTLASSTFAVVLNFSTPQVYAAQDEDQANAPYVTPRCDAEIVVEHSGQGQESWLEVIDNMEAMGAMSKEWANEYRVLINEYYSLPKKERGAWAFKKCDGKIKSST